MAENKMVATIALKHLHFTSSYFKSVIHLIVGVYGNLNTEGEARGVQIPIYTSTLVYNLDIPEMNYNLTKP